MHIMKNKNKKGFTLIELLVVIAIIAVLSVVVILSLNPAELLRQARDSNRISDMATIKSAISLFGADVATSSVNALGVYGTLYTNSAGSASTPVYTTYWGFASASVTGVVVSSSRAIDGTGWIPVNLSAISSGAPIGGLPVDPSNNSTSTVYAYVASSTVFKAAAKMESVKYGLNGSADVVSTDGGNSTTTFEVGTKLAL
jgi:type IV pilus assembly protein PilA